MGCLIPLLLNKLSTSYCEADHVHNPTPKTEKKYNEHTTFFSTYFGST